MVGKVSRWFKLKRKPNVTITSSASGYSLFHQNEVPVASRVASLLLQVFKLTFLEYLSPFLKVWCSVLWMLTWHQHLCPPEGIKWIIRGSGCLPWTSHLTRSLAFWRQFNFFVKIIASCKGPWIRLLGSYVPPPRHHICLLGVFTPVRSSQCAQSSVSHAERDLLKQIPWVGPLPWGQGFLYDEKGHKSKGSSVKLS